jgi:hypothetical protein
VKGFPSPGRRDFSAKPTIRPLRDAVPFSSNDPELFCAGYGSKGLKQVMVKTGQFLRSLHEWLEVYPLARRHRFTIAENDRISTLVRSIGEIEFVIELVCSLRSKPGQHLQGCTAWRP